MFQKVDLGEYIDNLAQPIEDNLYICYCNSKSNPQLKWCINVSIQPHQITPYRTEFINCYMRVLEHLKRINNENLNIVRIAHFENRLNQIVIVQEQFDDHLQSVLKEKKRYGETFDIFEALEIIKQVINGYQLLYYNNIIHRDLKPSNIFYINGVYKIGGFDLAIVMDGIDELTQVGTPKYISQEMFFEPTFTNKTDIFSLGIIFHELIFGCHPFPGNTIHDIKKALRRLQEYPLKLEKTQSGEVGFRFMDQLSPCSFMMKQNVFLGKYCFNIL